MLNNKYTSIERVLENVIRDTGFTEEIDLVECIEWAYRAMELIGAPQIYVEKVTDGQYALNHLQPIPVNDYKAELPCDMHQIIQIRDYCSKNSMREGTNNFIYSNNLQEVSGSTDNQYRINDGWIFTNFKEGVLEIAYYAFPTDDKGYPAIPDDERYLKAVEAYITHKISTRLWIQDKMSKDKQSYFENEWLFYVRSAKTRAQMPTIDGMESLKNQLHRLIEHPNRHRHQFEQLGDAEQIRIRLDRFGKNL